MGWHVLINADGVVIGLVNIGTMRVIAPKSMITEDETNAMLAEALRKRSGN